MHKVGVDMRVSVEDRDTGVETCLLQTPRWDYNWQRSYAYDTPITSAKRIRGGDRIHIPAAPMTTPSPTPASRRC